MILAEKIMDERKKNGWSQEELADKLGVSRQSVSKWESSQSVPDLQRILEMSKLFGVSTDYLLKDDEERQGTVSEESESTTRRVTLEEANAFLSHNDTFSKKISLGAMICIMCPVPLLGIMALQRANILPMAEDPAGALGVILLLLMVAISLIFFIPAGLSASKWEYLEKEVFDTEYGVDGMVRTKSDKFQTVFVRSITIGIILCIIGVISIFAGFVIDQENEAFHIAGCCGLMFFAALGCFGIIRAGIIKDGYEKLLQEGDYTKEKKNNRWLKMITPVYWMVATAIYLGWSFMADSWDRSWLVWVIAGILYGAVYVVLSNLHKDLI